jgi:hypothetical protein
MSGDTMGATREQELEDNAMTCALNWAVQTTEIRGARVATIASSLATIWKITNRLNGVAVTPDEVRQWVSVWIETYCDLTGQPADAAQGE